MAAINFSMVCPGAECGIADVVEPLEDGSLDIWHLRLNNDTKFNANEAKTGWLYEHSAGNIYTVANPSPA